MCRRRRRSRPTGGRGRRVGGAGSTCPIRTRQRSRRTRPASTCRSTSSRTARAACPRPCTRDSPIAVASDGPRPASLRTARVGADTARSGCHIAREYRRPCGAASRGLLAVCRFARPRSCTTRRGRPGAYSTELSLAVVGATSGSAFRITNIAYPKTHSLGAGATMAEMISAVRTSRGAAHDPSPASRAWLAQSRSSRS